MNVNFDYVDYEQQVDVHRKEEHPPKLFFKQKLVTTPPSLKSPTRRTLPQEKVLKPPWTLPACVHGS